MSKERSGGEIAGEQKYSCFPIQTIIIRHKPVIVFSENV